MTNQTVKLQPVPISPNPCATLLADDTKLSRLANELARDLYPFEQVISTYGITPGDFAEKIATSAVFMVYYAEARAVWNSGGNTAQRVALKAGILFEQWLETANTLLHDPNSPMADKVKLGTYLSRLAGFENVNPPPARDGVLGSGGAAPATVIINLNHGRQEVITKERIDPLQVEAEVVQLTEVRAATQNPDMLPFQINLPVAGAPPPTTPPPVTPHPDMQNRATMTGFPSKPVVNNQ